MTATATELDLALVPGFESELRCESKHTRKWANGRIEAAGICTVEAVFLFRRCDKSMLVCQGLRNWCVDNDSTNSHTVCLSNCYRFIPV